MPGLPVGRHQAPIPFVMPRHSAPRRLPDEWPQPLGNLLNEYDELAEELFGGSITHAEAKAIARRMRTITAELTEQYPPALRPLA